MALTDVQQTLELINTSQHILITGKHDYDGDVIASSLAFFLLLKKLHKRADIVFSATPLPQRFQFLPAKEVIKSNLGQLQKLVITIATKDNTPAELSYDKTDTELKINITPKAGMITPQDVVAENSEYKYDLIVVMGSPDLESLGAVYTEHPDFFYHTPIINIDHLSNNEHFGQINLVDLTTSSTSEIVFELLQTFGEELMDEDLATCLYTGMTVKTRSFKSPNLTPKTLHIASQLITQGADREQIITHLYRTKSVNVLKLWGRALARLQLNDQTKIGWSQLSQQDFALTGTSETDVIGIIDELIAETPQADVVLITYEQKPHAKALVYTSPRFNALHLTRMYEPRGHKQLAKIEFPNKTVAELERELIQYIEKQIQAKQK